MGISDDEIISPDNVSASLECLICACLYLDPVLGPCGHAYCRICIERSLNYSPRCPVCRTNMSIEQCTSAPRLREVSNAVQVCCERRCGWVGRQIDRLAHATVCPIALKCEFRLSVDRDENSLGLELDLADKVRCVIANVVFGVIESYNEGRKGVYDKQVIPGDCIVEVNGIRGDPQELNFLLRSSKLTPAVDIVLRRPTRFIVEIDKTGMSLGLQLSYTLTMRALLISSIKEGAVREYNATAKIDRPAVQEGDRIVEVNGVTGAADKLLETIRNSNMVTLVFHRYF